EPGALVPGVAAADRPARRRRADAGAGGPARLAVGAAAARAAAGPCADEARGAPEGRGGPGAEVAVPALPVHPVPLALRGLGPARRRGHGPGQVLRLLLRRLPARGRRRARRLPRPPRRPRLPPPRRARPARARLARRTRGARPPLLPPHALDRMRLPDFSDPRPPPRPLPLRLAACGLALGV